LVLFKPGTVFRILDSHHAAPFCRNSDPIWRAGVSSIDEAKEVIAAKERHDLGAPQ
jgi:hypothetical protein